MCYSKNMHKDFIRKNISLWLLGIFLFSIFTGLAQIIFVPSVSAASFNFIDKRTIKSGEQLFQDANIWDDTQGYAFHHDGCTDDFQIASGDFRSGSSKGTSDLVATLTREKYNSSNNKCEDQPSEQITITNRDVRYVKAYIIDDSTMFVPQAKGEGLFASSGDGVYNDVVFVTKDTSGEKHYEPVGSDGFDNGGMRILYDGNPVDQARYQNQDCFGTCSKNVDEDITLSTKPPDASVYPAAPKPGSVGGTKDTTGADNSCEAAGDWAWALCPTVNMISGVVEWLTTQVSRLLEVDRDKVTDPGLYRAWANIRNIALSLLVILMLVMVIATALNTQMFDAYTVKRALPRMVIAVVFIVLSWYICVALIDIFNAAGSGIMGIITSPFKDGGIKLGDIFSAGIGSFIANWVAVPGLVIGVVAVVCFFSGTVALFILIAFLTLILRQLFVIVLLLAAPLAILAWIFPGNDKLWKGWWSSFSKILMMYPIIMALLAAGRVFAYLANHAGGTSSGSAQGLTIEPLIALLAFTVPFGFIPLTFKMAGGLFATVSGMANDKSRGGFDRLKKRRGEKAQRWANGNAFKTAPTHSFRGKLNRGIEDAANIKQAGLRPSMMRENLKTARQDHAEEEVENILKDHSFTPWSGDDAKVHAARFTDRDDIENALTQFDDKRFGVGHEAQRKEAASQIMRSQKKHGSEAFQRARIRAQAKTGTGYQDEHGEFNAALMLQDINEAYGSDRNGAGKALAEMRGALTQSGQIAGQAGYGTWASQMENVYNARNDPNSADVAADAHRAIMQDTIDSVNPGYAVHGKPSSARALASAHRERIQGLIQQMNSGEATVTDIVRNPDGTPVRDPATNEVQTVMRPPNMEDIQAATAAAAGILDGLTQASPQNASAFAEELMVADVSDAGIILPPTRKSTARYKQDGSIEVDAAGHQVFDVEEIAPASRATNVRELITHFSGQSVRDAPAFHTRRKEYNSLIEAAAAGGGAAAAQAAGNMPVVPGGPTNP